MAINTIQNVAVDDSNSIFGGFIYNVDYQTFGGEAPSTLKLTLINEKGEYFIESEDLRVYGTPTRITIGSNIVLNMYLISYRFENSSVGRLLEVEFVDESVYSLDRFYVGLNERQDSGDNIILLGSYKHVESLLGLSLTLDPTEVSLLKVPQVLYTFPDLLTALSEMGILGFSPQNTLSEKDLLQLKESGGTTEGQVNLKGEYLQFYRNYTGPLRQVISAWCNDLGFLAYWENNKINFIDLRSPDNYKIIKQKVNAIIAAIEPSSVEESYSLRDTFVRGINSTFLKDGEIISNTQDRRQRSYSLHHLDLEKIPGMGRFKTRGTTGEIVDRIKAAHYGVDFLFSSMLYKEAGYNSKELLHPTMDNVLGDFHALNSANSNDLKKLKLVSQNFASLLPYNYQSYKWVEFIKKDEGEIESFTNRYRALADYQGRFFAMEFGYNPDIKFDSDLRWYQANERIVNTPLNKYLAPFSNLITNYESQTVQGVVLGKDIPTTPYDEITVTSRADLGYYIKEVEPHWFPEAHEELVTLGDKTVIVEVGGIDGFEENSFLLGIRGFDSSLIDNITFPTKSSFRLFGERGASSVLSTASPHISYHKTEYPRWEDGKKTVTFSSANVLSADVQQNTISEDLIRTQSKDFNNISKDNFEEAHSLLKKGFSFYQTDPFFSKTFTIPYIDLPNGDDISNPPSIKDGFQSLSISISDNGVQSTYVFGTENMKIRNSDFYIENYYDSRKKEALRLLAPKMVVSRGSSSIR